MVASAVAAAAAATASASSLAAARTGAARGALACVVYGGATTGRCVCMRRVSRGASVAWRWGEHTTGIRRGVREGGEFCRV